MTAPQECSREDCTIVTTGVCAQGKQDVTTCEFTKSVVSTPTPRSPPDVPSQRTIWTGEDLDVAEARKFTRSANAAVVVIAGAVGTGKTTIINALYERLQQGPLANHQFGGSQTLIALERRCHLQRTSSGLDVPETDRTPHGEAKFVHLRLGRVGESGGRDLLVTDLSGETFRLARNSVEYAAGLSFVKRANVLCVVLDGERLSNPAKRHKAVDEGQGILRSLIEAGLVPNGATVLVLISKDDQVAPSSEEYVAGIAAEFERRFTGRVQLSTIRVAARPRSDNRPFAFNLEPMLSHWLEAPLTPPPGRHSPSVEPTRAFDKLTTELRGQSHEG